MKKRASLDAMIGLLKTLAEANRLRILALLYYENLTISDFTFVLGQSQSLVSRHLRLLYEVRLIECYQNGGETYFKFCHSCCFGKDIVMAILSALLKHDVMLACDLARLADIRKKRRQMAKKYFLRNAAQWDALRLSYITDQVVESALLEIIGDKPFENMLSISIDTGFDLKLFSDLYRRAVEVTLESNVLRLSVGDTTFDLVLLHWALHFLENPEMALYEVARVLRPHGRVLIVDFVAHKVDSSYPYHAHMHLGFSDSQVKQWLKNVGLILEQTVCLAPVKNKNNERLRGTVWLARDPRLLVDDIKDKKVDFA